MRTLSATFNQYSVSIILLLKKGENGKIWNCYIDCLTASAYFLLYLTFIPPLKQTRFDIDAGTIVPIITSKQKFHLNLSYDQFISKNSINL